MLLKFESFKNLQKEKKNQFSFDKFSKCKKNANTLAYTFLQTIN